MSAFTFTDLLDKTAAPKFHPSRALSNQLVQRGLGAAYGWGVTGPAAEMTSRGTARDYDPFGPVGSESTYQGASPSHVLGAAIGAAVGPSMSRTGKSNRARMAHAAAKNRADRKLIQRLRLAEEPIANVAARGRVARRHVTTPLAASARRANAAIRTAVAPMAPGLARGGLYAAFGPENLDKDNEASFFAPEIVEAGQMLGTEAGNRWTEFESKMKEENLIENTAKEVITDYMEKAMTNGSAKAYAKAGGKYMWESMLSSLGPGVAAYYLSRLLMGKTKKPKNSTYEELDKYQRKEERKKQMAWLMGGTGATLGPLVYAYLRSKHPIPLGTQNG